MPVITVKMVEGASEGQKALLIEKITDAMKDIVSKNPEATHVIIEEVSPDNWGLGGRSVTRIREGK